MCWRLCAFPILYEVQIRWADDEAIDRFAVISPLNYAGVKEVSYAISSRNMWAKSVADLIQYGSAGRGKYYAVLYSHSMSSARQVRMMSNLTPHIIAGWTA